jgi:hypothetical protein
MNLGLSSEIVRDGMAREWGVTGGWETDLDGAVARLVMERYGRREWNRRL